MFPQIPKTQKAQLIREFGLNLEFAEIPVPEPKDDELLVHLLYSGVCHTDIAFMTNKIPMPNPLKLPLVAGHEGAGVVVKMGKNVDGFKVGDRVGVTVRSWHATATRNVLTRICNKCEYCKHTQHEHFCDHPENLIVHKPGTFQQYVTIAADFAHLIPENVDLAKAAPLQCAGVTVYRALKETGAKPGQFVALTGAGGGLGSFAIHFAKGMGLRPIAIDFGAAKKEHCLKQGAEFFVDAQNQDVIQEVRRLTNGKGPHAVVNIAPAEKPIEDALKYIRKTGTLVLVGLPDDGKFMVEIYPAVLQGLTIKGTCLGSREDVDEALDFMARGLVDIPVEIIGLSELPKILGRLDKGEINGRVVLDTSK